MDLKIIQTNNEGDVYIALLRKAIEEINPTLVLHDVWSRDFVSSIPAFLNEHVGSKSPIDFTNLPEEIKLETKLYWAIFLQDARSNSRSCVERRRMPMRWISEEWWNISKQFNDVQFISDIPSPEFIKNWTAETDAYRPDHNMDLLSSFSKYSTNVKRQNYVQEWLSENEIVSKEYWPARISIIGDFHKKIIINREQLKPLKNRNIIYINDLYTEQDVRFKDAQSRTDKYLNLYAFPEWMRDAIRCHITMKVDNREIGPNTIPGYFARFKYFRDFIHEKFQNPNPSLINNTLIGDDFIAWGNKKGLTGKNWYTDCYSMLISAAANFPGTWPALSVNSRVSRKIEKSHYKQGLGRIGHNKEGAGRSYSQNIIDQLTPIIKSAPYPIFEIYSLIVATGMRATDGHAILFDCLKDDVNDPDFMILTFWQNKVKSWNTKPLSKSNQSHLLIIKLIRDLQNRIIATYGKQTKYLFPTFTGTKESFISPSKTIIEIKKLCVIYKLLDDNGVPLRFSWHPLRHTKGTSMAADGHDVLSIMMELGHASPDMATVYVNNRLELRKRALIDKGSGRFFTIEGEVDNKLGELLVRKEAITATRVCGGACSMPAQIGDWCQHANACYTCKHFRADEKDVAFFKGERIEIQHVIDEQVIEIKALKDAGKTRMFEIISKRVEKNKQVTQSLDNIVKAIESNINYVGTDNNFKPTQLELLNDE